MMDKTYIKKFPEWQQKIMLAHSSVLEKLNGTSIESIHYGFQCDEGWKNLIELALYEMVRNSDEKDIPYFQVTQVKEKFGGLRIYYNTRVDTPKETRGIIHGVISTLEDISYKTCEMCGRPGTIRKTKWIRVLCEWCVMKGKFKHLIGGTTNKIRRIIRERFKME